MILFVTSQAGLYGSEKHVIELALYLKEQSEDICVLSFSHGIMIEHLNTLGIKAESIHWNSWIPSFSNIKSLVSFLKMINVSLVHSHQPRANFWMSIICRVYGLRHISTIHSTPVQHATNYTGLHKYCVYFFHLMIKFICILLSNKILFVSSSSAKPYSWLKKCRVIHNWVSPYLNQNNTFRKRNDKASKFLCLGSLTHSKGVLESIMAFSKIQKFYGDSTLTIVGSGSPLFISEIQNLINSLGINSAITISPYTPDVEKYFLDANFFISLSKDETFGLVYAEAMSYGLIIFAADIEVMHEILMPLNFFVKINDIDNWSVPNIKDSQLMDTISSKNINWSIDRYNYINQASKIHQEYWSV